MEILQGVLKQHLRPRAVVGYGVKIFLPSPPNYVNRLPGVHDAKIFLLFFAGLVCVINVLISNKITCFLKL